MSEISLQRTGLMSTKQRLDLGQFFKTKMKLIDESNSSTPANCSNGTLNTSLSSASSNSIFQSQQLNDEDSDESAAPSSVKQVLLNLNETACNYLNENSVEKHFSKFNREIIDKLDDYFNDLEKDLNTSLRRKYPRYSTNNQSNLISTSSLANRDNTDLNRLRNMINDYMSSMFVQMHNEICEVTYKMSLQMAENVVAQANGNHHKMSSASGQLGYGTQKQSVQDQNPVVSAVESIGKKIVGGIKLPFVNHSHSSSSTTTPSISSPSSSYPHGHTTVSANVNSSSESENAATIQPNETIVVKSSQNNSKSKRPISAQMYEANSQVSSSPGAPSQPAKTSLGSSSSNENIIESVTASSDDDLDAGITNCPGTQHQVSESSSKVSWREQGEGAAPPSINRTGMIESGTPLTVPIPAPRKTKSIMKQFLGGIGAAINPNTTKTTSGTNTANSASLQLPSSSQISTSPSSSISSQNNITSPKVSRQIDTINEEVSPGLVNNSVASVEEPKQLQHLNKHRPKRANVKKPTIKNPQTKIEVEAKVENLEEPDKIELSNKPEDPVLLSSQPPHLQIPPEETTKTKQVSPSGVKVSSNSNNQVEQPKISQNVLENVKLRSTVRYKPVTPQMAPSNGLDEILNARGIANRLSLFEQQKNEIPLEKEKEKPLNQFMNIRLKKTSADATTEISENSEEKESIESAKSPSLTALRPVTTVNFSNTKQIPPVPPNKPPRPAYNPPANPHVPAYAKPLPDQQQTSTAGNILVKLRPVSTAINCNNSNNENSSITNNSNLITLENNASIGVKHNGLISANNNFSSATAAITQPVLINNNGDGASSNDSSSGTNSNKLSGNEQDKRTSVREMVQMLSEESKA